MKYIEIKAPAKINIGLNILSTRIDGFHNLSTLLYPINDLFDVLKFTPNDYFEFTCDTKSIPDDETNLAVKAKILLERFTGKILRVKMELFKRIPSQAGLGGGSSDAAAVLISLNEMFQLGLKYDALLQLSLELGSDVPFFLKAKPAIGTSRGEILDQLDFEIDKPMVIVNPGINISTKEAFQNITPNECNMDFHSLVKDEKLLYETVKANVKNDFEDFVFGKYPEIGKVKTEMYNQGALFSLMSGSGSTVYGIFPNIDCAANAAIQLSDNPFVFISNPPE
jgi:4-diphosphocytidyl-2-C-methyl-D-erythritol kinase